MAAKSGLSNQFSHKNNLNWQVLLPETFFLNDLRIIENTSYFTFSSPLIHLTCFNATFQIIFMFRKTCSIKFVCLSSKNTDGPPSSVKQRTALSNARLGDGNISFPLDGSAVYDGIFRKFPKLYSVGGFDLLLFQRGGGEDGGLHKILPPHTPEHLKELCGQAKIYIRPVQQDITLNETDDITCSPEMKDHSAVSLVDNHSVLYF